MTTTILPSQNTEWGFWGTIARIKNDPAADPAKAWDIASRRIAEVTTASPEGVSRLPRQPPWSALRRRRRGRALEGRDAEGGDRRRRHPLDGLAHRPQDQPRDRDPEGAPLPDRLRQPLRDHGRASLLTPPASASAAHPRGCAARGRSRPGMVPRPRNEGRPDDQALRYPVDHPLGRRPAGGRQRAATARLAARRSRDQGRRRAL